MLKILLKLFSETILHFCLIYCRRNQSTQTTFLLQIIYCAFLSDVIEQLCFFCKQYKRSYIDISSVSSFFFKSTVFVLERHRDAKYGTVFSFFQEISFSPSIDPSELCTLKFKGHFIRNISK